MRELVATSPASAGAKPGTSWRAAVESVSHAVLGGLPGYLGAFSGKPALVAQLPQVCEPACVCVCVRACACWCACVHAFMCVCSRACMFVCICAFVRGSLSVASTCWHFDTTAWMQLWLGLSCLAVLGDKQKSAASGAAAAAAAAGGAGGDAAAASGDAAAAAGAGGVAIEVKILCENHDDGRTPAAWECKDCTSARLMCGDCDHFLHLARERRGHARVAVRGRLRARAAAV